MRIYRGILTGGFHLIALIIIGGCGGSGGDSEPPPPPPPPPQDMVQFDVALSGEQEVPPVDTPATAEASLTVNLETGEVDGELTIDGLDATAAHIHDAFAGTNGPILVPLDQAAGDPSLFTVPADAVLDEAEIDRLLAGALYVNVHTADEPDGAIRGQLLPEDFVLRFADLAGLQEVPQVETVARGRAAVTLDQQSGALVVQAQVVALDDADQAHVHEAYAGANGPVLVPLERDPMDSARWFTEDATLNEAGLDAFAAGRLYVNVHTPANPGGEIRGQILPEEITLLITDLTGEQEVPPVDTDADGLAALTLDEAGALLSLHVNTRGFPDADAAHLHNAFAGVNGPVEIGLIQDGSDPDHWFAEDETLSAAQLDALLAGATYVNVHSPANPGGEIRGQVAPPPIEVLFTTLSGDEEVPPVTSAATGIAASTVNRETGALTLHLHASGAEDATASHIHQGPAGENGPVLIGLEQDSSDVGHWFATGEQLDEAGLDDYRAGGLYVNLHTPANPDGEIRGQIVPPDAAASDDQETIDTIPQLLSDGAPND